MEDQGQGLGRELASPDKQVRDKTLKKLVKFLKKTERETGFEELDLLKIWKAIFYCMWYADKTPVQQELAQTISEILHCFRDFDTSLMFAECFFKTLQREWGGIDQYRIDKYYSLIRKFLHQLFVVLDRHDWEQEKVEDFTDMIDEVVFSTKSGVRSHVVDCYLVELQAVAGRKVDMDAIQGVLGPMFLVLLNKYESDVFFKQVVKEVISPLCDTYAPRTLDPETNELEEQTSGFRCLDLLELSDAIFKLAADGENLKTVQRETLYELRKKLRSAGKKIAVDVPPKPIADKPASKKRTAASMDSADDKQQDAKPKKKKKKTNSEAGAKKAKKKQADRDADVAAPSPSKKKRKNSMDEDTTTANDDDEEEDAKKLSKKKKKKKKKSSRDDEEATPVKAKRAVDDEPGFQTPKSNKKKSKVGNEEFETPKQEARTPKSVTTERKNVTFDLKKNQVQGIKKVTRQMKRTPLKKPTITSPKSVLKKTSSLPNSEPRRKKSSSGSDKKAKSAKKSRKVASDYF